MRLATVEPEAIDNRERMTFSCDCGFDYRQSSAIDGQAHTLKRIAHAP